MSLLTLPRPVAVVVSAGGVLGAAHVGVGHALEQRMFVPDLIVGTSVGALTGAIAAAHPDGAAPWLEQVWAQLRRSDVYPLARLSARGSIFSDRGLRRLIARAALPAPWDFGQSRRLINTASAAAGRFLDRLHIDGPGLYRVDDQSGTSRHSVSGGGR